jgi:hypothetical protein
MATATATATIEQPKAKRPKAKRSKALTTDAAPTDVALEPRIPPELLWQYVIVGHAAKRIPLLMAKQNPQYAPVIADLHRRMSAALAIIVELTDCGEF